MCNRSKKRYATIIKLATNSYPSSDFDDWADTYDQDVTSDRFPFIGYQQILITVIRLADAHPGIAILDLGTGTVNLVWRFLELGCRVTAMDFSSAMLDKARERLPGAALIQGDIHQVFPSELRSQKIRSDRLGLRFPSFRSG